MRSDTVNDTRFELPTDGDVLRARVEGVARHAAAIGALQPIATRFERVDEGGIGYALRVVDNLRRKQAAASRPPAGGKPANPFLPYEQDLYVAHVAPAHVLLLNKFNVIEPHLLLVTAAFEPQSAPLSVADFAAALSLLQRLDGLLFYNGGGSAGASQPHKHLQWVPCSLLPGQAELPIEARVRAGLGAPGQIRRADLPYTQAVARCPDAPDAPTVADLYRSLLRAVGIAPDAPVCDGYNWLMTRDWMMVVPRRREDWNGLSINALGFAGALLARNDDEAARMRAAGAGEILSAVSG